MDESTTLTVKPKVPRTVGIPLIVPDELRVKLEGNEPDLRDQ